MLEQLRESFLGDLELGAMLLNVALALGMGQILAWHYRRFARVLSNKRKFSRLFVFLTATTMLMISVVKTSLALSLGLVGALSIVRFRTPIKEPEELAYLFLAIATGIGLGADQRLVTILIVAIVLGYLALRHGTGSGAVPFRTLLQVSAPLASSPEGRSTGREELHVILETVERVAGRVDLRRVDCSEEKFHGTLLIEVMEAGAIERLVEDLRRRLPGATLSLVERDGLE